MNKTILIAAILSVLPASAQADGLLETLSGVASAINDAVKVSQNNQGQTQSTQTASSTTELPADVKTVYERYSALITKRIVYLNSPVRGVWADVGTCGEINIKNQREFTEVHSKESADAAVAAYKQYAGVLGFCALTQGESASRVDQFSNTGYAIEAGTALRNAATAGNSRGLARDAMTLLAFAGQTDDVEAIKKQFGMSTVKGSADLKVTAVQLVKDFDSNEARFEDKFLGKTAVVSGKVEGIYKSGSSVSIKINGAPSKSADDRRLQDSITCEVGDDSEKAAANDLNKGQTAKFKGEITKNGIQIKLLNCSVL